MNERYDIDKEHLETIIYERILDFLDDYPDSKCLVKTYGVRTPNLIKKNNKVDVFITRVKQRERIKIERIKENLEFIKDYFNLKEYELEFYHKNSYYTTIYYDRTRNRPFFRGEYVQCRFTR